MKRQIYTYQDYAKLPEGAPYQLIQGALIREPAPGPYHQILCQRIGFELAQFVEARNLGVVLLAPIEVYFSETEVYQPDLLYISKGRLQIIGERKIEAAPDLVGEILSPTSAYYDLRHKMQVYEEFGVQEYWIVDPMDTCVEVYRNEAGEFRRICRARGQGLVHSSLLVGFEIDVEKLFRKIGE